MSSNLEAGYGSLSSAVGSVPDQTKADAMSFMKGTIQKAEEEGQKMKKEITDGNFGFRMAAFMGGLALIVVSLMSILGDVVTLSVTGTMQDVFLAIFGVIMVLLETRRKTAHKAVQARDFLANYFKFLDLVWGRGFFYCYVGVLAIGRFPSILTTVVGCFILLCGVIAVISGGHASMKLSKLKSSMKDKGGLKKAFSKYDVDASGGLSSTEFANLAKDLGSELKHAELEAAILTMDKDRNGVIDFDEFMGWWTTDSGSGKFAI